jgi:hypothetical protein
MRRSVPPPVDHGVDQGCVPLENAAPARVTGAKVRARRCGMIYRREMRRRNVAISETGRSREAAAVG